MATASLKNTRRKIIDLPVDTIQKLSVLSVAQDLSLKAFIEKLLISKGNQVEVKIRQNPSPSNDPWFNDPDNLASIDSGIADKKAGRTLSADSPEVSRLLEQ